VTADKLIRIATALVVSAVAAFAAIVSYSHIYDLARVHGQAGTAARLLPLSVDGLILAASLVLLHEARADREAPGLAQLMLGLGVAATVGANVLFGLPWGWLGAVISSWPAVAFVGSVETALHMARSARSAPVPVPGDLSALNGHTAAAAELFAADLEAGRVPGIRKIRRELHLGQPKAQQVQASLAALIP
jgi:Protein of unknown function (DUF2637)